MSIDSSVYIVRAEPQYPAFPYSVDDLLLKALRSLFSMWGKNPQNPFNEWLRPGGRVVIKPNWVLHDNPNEKGLDALVTHSSLIKHVIDLLAVALEGKGSIIIGDAPLQSCDFQALITRTRVAEVAEEARKKHPSLDVKIEDWRLTVFENASTSQRRNSDYVSMLSRDYQIIDLGPDSFLEDISDYAERFRVTCYDPHMMAAHHQKGKHEYLVTRKVFDADLLINLPKMKTHIKAGLTGALKNLVGINGHKEFLPHHILGSSESGGDCYYKGNSLRNLYDSVYDRFWTRYAELPESRRKLGTLMLGGLWRASRILTRDSTSAGSWYGNETIWRMTLDLNHLLYFGNHAPKQIISIVDGIVAGEGEGPLSPTAKPAGLLIGGENPAYVDAVLGKLMGYNISRVPTAYHAIYHRRSQFSGPYLENFSTQLCEDGSARLIPFDQLPNFDFIKPEHWKRAAISAPVVSSSQADAYAATEEA
jgi:uncharacterized protein (DUF362 family)